MGFLRVTDWGRYSFLMIMAIILPVIFVSLWAIFDFYALCFFPIYFFGMLYILQEIGYC